MPEILTQDPVIVDLAKARECDFERKVVVRLIDAAGHRDRHAEYLQQRARPTGCNCLDLAWFCETYKEFPLQYVFARRFENDALPFSPDAFTRFTNTPVFQAFKNHCKDKGINDYKHSIGMFFNIGANTMILHNLEKIRSGPRLVRTIGKPPITFQVQTLGHFLCAIDAEWAHVTSPFHVKTSIEAQNVAE